MKIYNNLLHLPTFLKPIITIGTFDGVHLGHQQILSQLKKEAHIVGGETVVITFNQHPRKVVGDTTGVQLLTTLDEKIALFETAQIDNLVIVDFDDAFANQSASDYAINFLYQHFKPHTLIIGYDHQFGYKRLGNYQLLESIGKEYGFLVKEIPQHLINTAIISSTQIRKALLHKHLSNATQLLGYAYFFSGTVIRGDQIGRTIGYPTANIQINQPDKLVPGDGVYAVIINITNIFQTSSSTILQHYVANNIALKGMMYIGSRPVVNGKRRVIEVNIFEFDEDIYDATIKVTLQHWVRGDFHFNGLTELTHQLAIDKLNAIQLLA